MGNYPEEADAVVFDLGKPLEENFIDYSQAPGQPWPTFVRALPWGVVGSLVYLIAFFPLAGRIQLSQWFAALLSIPMAFAISSLLSDARTYNQAAGQAIATLVGANDATIVLINAVKNQNLWEHCYRSYILLLRSIFCLSVGREFKVRIPGVADESGYYERILQWLMLELRDAGLDKELLVGNGRLTQVVAARSAIKTVLTIGIPRGTYVANLILFLMVYSAAAGYMIGEKYFWTGLAFSGLFSYAMSLLLILAQSRSLPYGDGREQIEMNSRFKRMEVKCAEARAAAVAYQKLKATQ